MPRRLLPLLLLLPLAACGRPTDAAVQFHDALAASNGAKAFELLSARTQARLTEIAKAAHAATGGAVSDDPAVMIAHGDPSLYPSSTPAQPHVARAALVSETGPRAKVTVRIGEAAHEMDLIREKGRWRIDLPLAAP